ncbi:MAG TPA: alpha-L-arabinofuranosidase, partial [Candidatus Gallimonas intestinigallinarum]|nr:alpha-L-arabinofuranosidase [Candidatus Gallimonas intestinigallinarum]
MKITLHEEGKVPVRPGGTGMFLEDINYALDGGLYAELLENRNFEAKLVHGKLYDYRVEQDGRYAWSAYPSEGSVALKIKDDRPLFVENPHYMRIEA